MTGPRRWGSGYGTDGEGDRAAAAEAVAEQQLYRREREMRVHMARKQEMLEQRVRELLALNALFRRHLEERSRSR